MEEKLLYKYIIGKTDEAENELIFAWLQESEEHRKELFELKNIMNATRSEGRAVMDADTFMRGVNEKIARKKNAFLMRRLCSAAAAILLLVGLAFAARVGSMLSLRFMSMPVIAWFVRCWRIAPEFG